MTHRRIARTFLVALAAAAAATSGFAEDPPATKPAPRSDTAAQSKDKAAAAPASIQWFATWTAGSAEAKRTGRPILLLAAAPQCHGVSGLW